MYVLHLQLAVPHAQLRRHSLAHVAPHTSTTTICTPAYYSWADRTAPDKTSAREDEYQALPQPPSLPPPPPPLADTLSLMSVTTKCVVHQHANFNRDNHLKSTALPLPLSTPQSAPAPTSSLPQRRVSTPHRVITSYLPCTRHSLPYFIIFIRHHANLSQFVVKNIVVGPTLKN